MEKHFSSSFHKIANTISWGGGGIHSYSYIAMSISYSGAYILPTYINYYIAIMSIQRLLKKCLKDKLDTNKIMVVTQEPTIMQSNKDILCNNNQNIIMQSSKIKVEGNQKKIKNGCNTRTNHVAIQVKHFAEIWSYQMISCKVKKKLKDQKS